MFWYIIIIFSHVLRELLHGLSRKGAVNMPLPKNKINIEIHHDNCWIDHFTVVCLVAWPFNESEAGVDHVLIEASLSCFHAN